MSRIPVVALAAVALAACAGDSTGPAGPKSASLSFSTTNPSASPSVSASPLSRDLTITSGADALVLTRVQLVLGEVELKTSETVTCDNSGPGSDPSCAELDVGPVLVDLPLSAGVQTDMTVTIPEGTYREIEFKLELADDDTGAEAAFLAANPGFRNTSVRVEGTFNGQPFVFTSSVEAEMEFHLEPPMVVDATGANVTVFVDVGSWFRAAGGVLINPANLSGTLRSTVEANIRASFEAFGDDDRDGRHG